MINECDVLEEIQAVRDNVMQLPQNPASLERELWSCTQIEKRVKAIKRIDIDKCCKRFCDDYCKYRLPISNICPIYDDCPLKELYGEE